MISVYYNQKYGFLIVPNAIERFMGCYISIEPTIEIMAEETIDKIGCAIRKGIKIAESSPKVDESQLNNFWKQTKYKSFPTFSKNYQRIDLKQNGDELEIRRWERNNRGGYSRKTEEKDGPWHEPSSCNNGFSFSGRCRLHRFLCQIFSFRPV